MESKNSKYATWLKTFNEEKGVNLNAVFEVRGPSGMNSIPLQVVIEHILQAPAHEQAGIQTVLMRMDFCNAPVLPYYQHLAQAIAI